MTALLRPISLLRKRTLIAGLLLITLASVPASSFARTRTTVTLGDPDIGDNGQKPGPVTSAASVASPSRTPERDGSSTYTPKAVMLWLLLRYGVFYR